MSGPPRRGVRQGSVVLLGLLLSACAPALSPVAAGRPAAVRPALFEVGRDTFAFPNLVRAERPGRNDAFANYCLVMARAASQFYRFARFAPEAPRVAEAGYARLTRAVIAIAPWADPRPDAERIVIPGYANLHAFSLAHERAIKDALGSNLLSMFHWRTWRIAVAFRPAHQEGVARDLQHEVGAGRPAPLMVTNFPDPDLLNHAVLVYDYRVGKTAVEFLAYDPNDPGNPLSLHFDPVTSGFWIEPLPYSPPGRVRAFRLFTSPLF